MPGPRGSARSPRVRTPQQARSRRTRERILLAAVACFEQGGYDETTTAAIASRAGIGVGTLYGYFQNKRDVLLELLDRTVKEVAELVIERLRPEAWRGSDPRETVRSLIDAVFHAQQLRPGLQRIMWERFFKDPEFRAPVEAIQRRTIEAIERFLDAVEPERRLRTIDRDTAAFAIFNAVQWNATRSFMDEPPERIDAVAGTVADMVARFLFRDAT